MIARFADTSYFLALLIPNDEMHAAAMGLAANWAGPLFTTDFVLLEVANHLSPVRTRNVYAPFHRVISNEARMTIVAASRHWIEQGQSLYSERGDKGWSLTDCISFRVMRDRNLTDALTADHHFAQAGFNILMK